MEKQLELNAKSQQIIRNYLDSAHGDYKAARHLLRNGFLDHGTMIGATCVEKLLKAIVGIGGVALKDHLSPKLVSFATRHHPNLLTPMDRDFIKFLDKAYALRYAPVSKPGFAIVFNQYRTLVALDNLVARLDSGFTFTQGGQMIETPYRAGVREKDEGVIAENSVVDAGLLLSLPARANKVREMRVEDDYGTFMVDYETDGVSLDGSYTKLPEGSLAALKAGHLEFTLTKG